jgi:integrative and conjugative element protein (TIGR02256 family)
MRFVKAEGVRVVLPRAALVAIFDECDRFDQDETGGRIVGTYADRNDELVIKVTGVIGPGPNARRTSASFFQDGEYQENIFRGLEEQDRAIEHLGNWHTHHVNGFSTLSRGDIDTYRRTVNHENHNTAFFYALLVVAKNASPRSRERYSVKHYLLRRDDSYVYEVPPHNVELTEDRLVFPGVRETSKGNDDSDPPRSLAYLERIYDRDILSAFYPGIHPYKSKRLDLYWRGPVELVDGSRIEAIVVETALSNRAAGYSVALRKVPEALNAVAERLSKSEFSSARAALISAERVCNGALYEGLRAQLNPTTTRD